MLSQWYDSGWQRKLLLAQDGSPEIISSASSLTEEGLGQLRWDAIRSPYRIQTAAQILDGAIFHLLGNESAIERIGVPSPDYDQRTFPFIVITSGTGLESSLREMVGRPFFFSSIASDKWQLVGLQEELRKTSSREKVDEYCSADGTVEGAIRLLRETGILREDELRRLGRSWGFWLRMEREGRLITRQAQPYGDDAQSFALEGWGEVEAELSTAAGRAVLRQIPSDATRDQQGVRRRSLVWSQLEPLARSGDQAEHRDAAILRNHFDRVYYRNITQKESGLLSSQDDMPLQGVRRRAAFWGSNKESMVTLPHDFKRHIGSLSQNEWQDFIERTESELHEWWADPRSNIESLQAIGDRLQRDYVDPGGRYPETGKTTVTSILWGLNNVIASTPPDSAAGLGVVFAAGAAITYIVSGSVKSIDRWNRDRKTLYDVVEVFSDD
ncbi:hypothetical protein [Streptomyces griseochromogenes]|uniref:hypothetical protein n=1 Tax=Streptomyces griseochromogenes TaxID=68214 RepID=UPI0037B67900